MTIYLDNAATTAVDPKVLKSMIPFFLKYYGNASEFHTLGRESKLAMEKSRSKIAKFLSAQTNEIFFTSGATESINLTIKGLVEAVSYNFKNNQKPHIITSTIEHKAVLETCRHMERSKVATVSYLPVNRFGLIDVNDIAKSINKNTVLISIMYVNNEVGTIEPIEKIGKLIKKLNKSNSHSRVYFHSDATQAPLYLDCNVDTLGVDYLSLSGHKMYAPKGIGILYKRQNTPLIRQNDGGAQESEIRSGTENIPYIVGLGKAIEQIPKNRDKNTKKISSLRDCLIASVLKIPSVRLTGHPTKRVPHIASFVVKGIEGEAIVIHLSNKKIFASSGSACTASDLKASHVLSAMGIPAEVSHGSLRFSLSTKTKLSDIKTTAQVLRTVVSDLRKISPDLKGYIL